MGAAESSGAASVPPPSPALPSAAATPPPLSPAPLYVAHMRQRSTWDCGAACAAMVVVAARRRGAAGVADAAALVAEMESERARFVAAMEHPRVWSIDVALFLARALAPSAGRPSPTLRFTSTYLGVNPSHASLSYYADIDEDRERVEAALAASRELAVDVAEASVGMDTVCERAAGGRTLWLMLVDARHLACDDCRFKRAVTAAFNASYAGHYIVVTHYDFASDRLQYLDPASSATACHISPAALDIARRAEGTDEDLLEVRFADAAVADARDRAGAAAATLDVAAAADASSHSAAASPDAGADVTVGPEVGPLDAVALAPAASVAAAPTSPPALGPAAAAAAAANATDAAARGGGGGDDGLE